MSKVLVVYYTETGNTETMANAVEEGAKSAGAEVTVSGAEHLSADLVSGYDAIAFGCPAKGAEELDESYFEPFFDQEIDSLKGKKIVLFGSYGWGDGEWMRTWEERVKAAGIDMLGDGIMANYEADETVLEALREAGAKLAA